LPTYTIVFVQGIGQVLAVLKDMRAAFDRLASRVDTVETNVAILAAAAQNRTAGCDQDSVQVPGYCHEQLSAFLDLNSRDLILDNSSAPLLLVYEA
jgi:hypothetical protein